MSLPDRPGAVYRVGVRISSRKAGATALQTHQQRNIETVAKVEADVLRDRSSGERLSRWLVRRIGTPTSVGFHALVILAWVSWNSGLLPGVSRFDPLPFSLLGLVATLEATLLGLLILASQNRLQHEVDRRFHLGLQINMLAEAEATKTLEMLHGLYSHFGLEVGSEDVIDELKSDTDPQRIVETIQASMPTET